MSSLAAMSEIKEELVPVEETQVEAETTIEPDMASLFVQVQAELGQVQDRYLRLAAEFENYKKRADRDRQMAVRFAGESILHDLLPVMDSLEQALVVPDASENLLAGLKMVLKQFQDALAKYGISSFSATGQIFDPQKHEAVAQIEDANVPEGHVIQEFQKGYMLNERLIRPARVVVSKGAVQEGPSQG